MSFTVPNYLQITKNTPIDVPIYSGASDWVSITGAVTNEVLLLVCDGAINTFSLRTTSTGGGNIYIDWGDSFTSTITTGAQTDTEHTYSSGGTASTRGYNTWKIRVYSDGGTRITNCKVIQVATEFAQTSNGLLQAWYGDNTVTTMQEYFFQGPEFTFLEYVRVPEGMTSANAIYRTFFLRCTALQKVDLPTNLSFVTTLAESFYFCTSLYELSDFPMDMTGITSCNETFSTCKSLSKVVLPPIFPNCTTINRMFDQCHAMGSVNLPDLPNCTGWALAFNNNFNLRSINIKTFKSGVSHSSSGIFNACSKLQSVRIDPTSTATVDGNSMFNGCYDIISVTLPPNWNITSYATMFQNCVSLKEVSLPMNATNVTAFNSMFNQCYNLQSVTLPTTGPSGTFGANNMFQDCRAISEIIFPNSYSGITTLSQSFLRCNALTNLVLPATLNSCTSMQQFCYENYALNTITFPTSHSALTNLSQAFINNYSLKEFEMVATGATAGSITNMEQMFYNNYALQKVKIASNSTNINVQYMFFENRALTEVVGFSSGNFRPWSSTNYQQMFRRNYSLRTINLGDFAGLGSGTTANNMFNECYSLTGITGLNNINTTGTTQDGFINFTEGFTGSRNLLSLDFSTQFSKLEVQGTDTGTGISKLNSLRLRNTRAGQWGGISPQINVSYTSLSTAALNTLFADMAALGAVTSKTINITSATGAAGLTAGDRLVITSLGWTITG
jgi:hypothetical protein